MGGNCNWQMLKETRQRNNDFLTIKVQKERDKVTPDRGVARIFPEVCTIF